jgi:D-alanine-D-alanine ligase
VTTVLVLGGGPDAERPVSLTSARAIADALGGRFTVQLETIDRLSPGDLARMSGDVIFPALHGSYGEGGPLQDVLEADGRPYVGSGPASARACMDKLGTKLVCASLGIKTPRAGVFDPRDDGLPMPLPLVLKPTHDGSSVGLHMCTAPADWEQARAAARMDVRENPGRCYMAERLITGQELTVGLIGRDGSLEALPIVEICAARGVYDYQAKYERTDTTYTVEPKLPPGAVERACSQALEAAHALDVRDLARVDFVLDHEDELWMLEVNTMPGFTPTSLLPKAAQARGLSFEDLCEHLVLLALSRTGD